MIIKKIYFNSLEINIRKLNILIFFDVIKPKNNYNNITY